MTKRDFHFFLGGQDLEMTEIAKMLEANGQSYDDAQMQWGAAASKYGNRIAEVAASGKTPVLIELAEDTALPKNAISVDHHGARSHEPASIAQVADLLGLQMTRDQELVAANDRGYINGMQRAGATAEEISDIRARDRAAQGVTPEHEAQAEAAMQTEREFYSPDNLAVVRCTHSKVSPIMDRYRAREGGGPKGILVLSDDGEVNYSGPGHIAKQLSEYFPENSWSGGEGLGNPDGEAFFGMNAGKASVAVHAAVVALTAIDNRDVTRDNAHRVHADFLGYNPWVDREDENRTLEFEGGFYAVQLSHEAESPVPARIWRENGGSFTDWGRLPDGAEEKAWEGLDPSSDKDYEVYNQRFQRMLVLPMDYAKQIGASHEIQHEIRKSVAEEKTKGRLIASSVEGLETREDVLGKSRDDDAR
jgi:hypothetical protein